MGSRLPRLKVVEWRPEMIETEHRVGFQRPDFADHNVWIARDSGQQVKRRSVEHIDLAAAQCAEGNRRIRNDHPFHTVYIHQLAAGEATGGFRSGDIAGKFLVDQLGTRPIFGLDKAEWAR